MMQVPDTTGIAVNVQWRNTDLCVDWSCSCSRLEDKYEWHTDGDVYGRLECERCGRVFQLLHTVVAIEVEGPAGRGGQ